jgi:hypothetical protein
MVGRNPFFTAVAVGAGTMVALGGSTILVSGMGIAVAKRVARTKRLKMARPCSQCGGEGYLACDVCLRTCIVRCRAPRSMRDIMNDSRSRSSAARKGAEPTTAETTPAVPVYCSCPACGTSGYQRCLNCLGDGRV